METDTCPGGDGNLLKGFQPGVTGAMCSVEKPAFLQCGERIAAASPVGQWGLRWGDSRGAGEKWLEEGEILEAEVTETGKAFERSRVNPVSSFYNHGVAVGVAGGWGKTRVDEVLREEPILKEKHK